LFVFSGEQIVAAARIDLALEDDGAGRNHERQRFENVDVETARQSGATGCEIEIEMTIIDAPFVVKAAGADDDAKRVRAVVHGERFQSKVLPRNRLARGKRNAVEVRSADFVVPERQFVQ